MKDIKQFINEGKESLSFLNTVDLIDSLKTWYQYMDIQLENEEYLEKNIKKNVASFINDTLINADYTDEIISELIKHYKLNIKSEDDWTKVQEAFLRYIIED